MCVCGCVCVFFVSEGFDRGCLQRTLALTTKCCVGQGSQDFATPLLLPPLSKDLKDIPTLAGLVGQTSVAFPQNERPKPAPPNPKP